MKKNIRFLIFLAVLVSSFIVFMIVISHSSSGKEDKDQQERMMLIGRIQFKGKVINSKTYRYSDKDYYLVCIKLDYSNTKDICLYNDVCCLKIKNGIATLAAGVLDKSVGVASYVEVNIGYNRKITLRYTNGDHDSFILTLATSGLPEQYMSICN